MQMHTAPNAKYGLWKGKLRLDKVWKNIVAVNRFSAPNFVQDVCQGMLVDGMEAAHVCGSPTKILTTKVEFVRLQK